MQLGVGMRGDRVRLGQRPGDIPGQVRMQALRRVETDQLLEFPVGVRLDARLLRREQRAVHLPFRPHLAVPGAGGRAAAGEDRGDAGDDQRVRGRSRAGEALCDAGGRDDAVVDVQDRIPRMGSPLEPAAGLRLRRHGHLASPLRPPTRPTTSTVRRSRPVSKEIQPQRGRRAPEGDLAARLRDRRTPATLGAGGAPDPLPRPPGRGSAPD